ncbi:50S ribosomal protein L24 [Euzebya tangerina]|uniref:50S ribosomal protein L24 n=1 Tax=Euzebya tangerina TaxID=591198 RepID=UPI000E320363|nr:50S ribosomal protein L24 [Euzebya tangerina]
MQRVKKDDQVVVISGKDKGKTGRVVNVYPKADKVMVEGVNIATRHRQISMTSRGAREGGIEHVEVPVHLSNVMPVCPKCDEPTRVGVRFVDGEKMRFCRKCDSEFS